MESPENIQPEERFEDSESVENVEEQTLQDATHEPGARVEETQTFEQAESVEGALVEAVDEVSGTPQTIPPEAISSEEEDGTVDRDDYDRVDGSELSETTGEKDDGGDEATPINVPSPVENQVEGEGGDQVAHVDHWSEERDPGDDPPPPNLEADDGSELMKEGQGGRPGDDVSATPINLP